MKNILLLTLAITANYLTSHFSIANNYKVQPAKSSYSQKVCQNSNKGTFVKTAKGNENIFSSLASADIKQTDVERRKFKK